MISIEKAAWVVLVQDGTKITTFMFGPDEEDGVHQEVAFAESKGRKVRIFTPQAR